MGVQTYGNGTNSSQGANTILHFYDKAGIKAANRVNIYSQWSKRKAMPKKMGKTFKISKFMHMYDRSLNDAEFGAKGYLSGRDLTAVQTLLAATDGTGASLTEGSGATNERTLQKVTVEATLARYGEMITYTDEVELFSEDAMQVRYREELGELANSRFEDLVQLDMMATPTKMYSGDATAMSEIAHDVADDGSDDAEWKVSYDLIRKGIRRLVRNRAKKNTQIVTGSTKIDTKTIAAAYYAIIDADIKSDLETLTRGNGYSEEFAYVPFHKYGDAATAAQGEVGAMHEARFIESEAALVNYHKGAAVSDTYAGSLAYSEDANGDKYFDVHSILFPTEGSFATIGLKGMGRIKFNSKSPDDVDLTNPYATKGFFSYSFYYSGLILEPEKLLRVDLAVSK